MPNQGEPKTRIRSAQRFRTSLQGQLLHHKPTATTRRARPLNATQARTRGTLTTPLTLGE